MQTRDAPSVLPLLLPWMCFLALTVAMPACEMKPREVSHLAKLSPETTLEIDATLSERAP